MPKAVRAKSKISVWTQSRGYQVQKREQNARKYGIFRGLEKTTKHCTFGLIKGYLREKVPRNNIKTSKQTFWMHFHLEATCGWPRGPFGSFTEWVFWSHICVFIYDISLQSDKYHAETMARNLIVTSEEQVWLPAQRKLKSFDETLRLSEDVDVCRLGCPVSADVSYHWLWRLPRFQGETNFLSPNETFRPPKSNFDFQPHVHTHYLPSREIPISL